MDRRRKLFKEDIEDIYKLYRLWYSLGQHESTCKRIAEVFNVHWKTIERYIKLSDEW